MNRLWGYDRRYGGFNLGACHDPIEGPEMLKTIITCGVLAIPLLLAAPNIDAIELDTLIGRYTFNWKTAPIPKKCLKIENKLLSEFRSKAYACDLKEKSDSASGEVFVQCTKKDDTAQYMIFKKAESCEKERQTQESNGDG
jgi:hypothetical protein